MAAGGLGSVGEASGGEVLVSGPGIFTDMMSKGWVSSEVAEEKEWPSESPTMS